MSSPRTRPNPLAPSSPRQVQVAASAGASAAALGNQLTVEIVLHASGTLSYTNRNGDSVVLSIALPAGRYAIEAAAITANSSDLTCFMVA